MNIKFRLFLALLGATGAVVLCMFFLLQWSMDRDFLRYVNTVEQERLDNLAIELELAYSENGNWDFLRPDPGRWLQRLERDTAFAVEPPPRPEKRQRDGRDRPPRSKIGRGRLVLLDAAHNPVFGHTAGTAELSPLRVEGKLVGYLGLHRREHLTEPWELRFVEQQKLAMGVVAGVIFLVSAGLAFPLANHLLRPIRALATATHRLAAGQYVTRVPSGSADELGGLVRDFNALAHTLEKNEQSRRQWFADISHELRTPLAVLRGEIEAIEDEVHQPTPETVRSLHAEVMHLSRLIDDLHELALSDVGALTYRKEQVDLTDIISAVVDSFRPEMSRKGITASVYLAREELPVFADSERLRQLFANLLDNAVKYTEAGGQVEVRLERQTGEAAIHVRDSAPGVPEPEIEKLFNRFYRVDRSRCRRTGGAGLGLAICRNIADAHGGTIDARPSPLGGLWLEVKLPLVETGG